MRGLTKTFEELFKVITLEVVMLDPEHFKLLFRDFNSEILRNAACDTER